MPSRPRSAAASTKARLKTAASAQYTSVVDFQLKCILHLSLDAICIELKRDPHMSLANIARENADIIERGSYDLKQSRVDISHELQQCLAHTRLYTPEQLTALLEREPEASDDQLGPRIDITTEKTSIAGRRLALEGLGNPCLLNFASARNPGGGYVRGAKAQEEDLARASALYHCQLTQRPYYDANRRDTSLIYSDHMIYSPRVPFFRDEKNRFLARSIELSVITAPAPNAGALARAPESAPEYFRRLYQRARMVLAIAHDQGHRELVLGAWGCGVFRNDPSRVADAFAEAIHSPQLANAFDRIVFAIYEREKDRPRWNAFCNRFES